VLAVLRQLPPLLDAYFAPWDEGWPPPSQRKQGESRDGMNQNNRKGFVVEEEHSNAFQPTQRPADPREWWRKRGSRYIWKGDKSEDSIRRMQSDRDVYEETQLPTSCVREFILYEIVYSRKSALGYDMDAEMQEKVDKTLRKANKVYPMDPPSKRARRNEDVAKVVVEPCKSEQEKEESERVANNPYQCKTWGMFFF
tara:strand:- start:1160 stop:1750 length:591 start_codon:yes stop_codon:yes gene_type:complete